VLCILIYLCISLLFMNLGGSDSCYNSVQCLSIRLNRIRYMPILNLLPPLLSNLLLKCLWLIYCYVLRFSSETFVLTVCALQLKSPLVPRKPLKPDNTKHSDVDDSCSVASGYALINLFFFVYLIL
jgi:hypothetical protein